MASKKKGEAVLADEPPIEVGLEKAMNEVNKKISEAMKNMNINITISGQNPDSKVKKKSGKKGKKK